MGGKTGTSTSSVSIPPEVLARYNAVNAQAQQVASTPFQPYTGQFVAGITPTQQAGINATSQYSQMAQPYYQAAASGALSGGQAVNPQQLNISQFMSPYTSQVAEATANMLRQQQGQQTTQQEANAIMSGAFGGDRSNLASAQLAGQQNLAMAQAMAPIYQQGYSQALGAAQQQQGVYLTADQANRAAQMQMASQLGQLGSGAQAAALQGAQAQIGAGTLEQQTQQADLTAQYQQFLQERGYPFQVAQFLANIAMGTGALSGSTTTSQYPMPFFSDRRLKEDVKEIGKTNDGQPIYSFKYKGKPGTQIGLMAQDVEKNHPEAVYETQGGIKAVDYKAATRDAEKALGGSVSEPGSYDRGGYDLGGAVYDPQMIREILAQQREGMGPFSEGGIYGQKAASSPFAGKGIVPAANLPVASLKTATPPEQGKGGESQVQSALDTIDKIGSTYSKASSGVSKLSDWWSGKDKDEEEKAHGGGVMPRHAYALSGAVTKDPVIPGEDDDKFEYFPKDILDVTTASNQTDTQKAPQPTSQSGIGLGTLASIFGLFLKNGGAVPRHGYATDGFVNPDFISQDDEFGQTIDTTGLGAGAKLPPLPESRRKIEPSVAGLDTTADIIANALKHVETSGRNVVGPVANKKGNRPYGLYQVMDFNVPNWTNQYLGQSMTPDEFLNNEEAQDTLMRTRIKEQLMQGYDPKDIASIHFTGTTADKAGNRKDILGTTTPAYLAKFTSAMGGPEQGGVVPTFASAELPSRNAAPAQSAFDGEVAPPEGQEPRPSSGGLTDYLRENQGWMAPLGGFLKGMVQSRSPFLGGALLEGLGTGLESVGPSQRQLLEQKMLAPVVTQRQITTMNDLTNGWLNYKATSGQDISLEEYARMIGYTGPIGMPPRSTVGPSNAPQKNSTAVEENVPQYKYDIKELGSAIVDRDGVKIPAMNDPLYLQNFITANAGVQSPVIKDKVAAAQRNLLEMRSRNKTTDVNGNDVNLPGVIEAGREADIGKNVTENIKTRYTDANQFEQAYDNSKNLLSAIAEYSKLADMNKATPELAEAIGRLRSIPGFDKFITPEMSTIQGAADATTKAAITAALQTVAESGSNAQKAILNEAVQTIARPDLSPEARQEIVAKAIARLERERQRNEDWFATGEENGKFQDPLTFNSKWNKNPENSLDSFTEKARKEIGIFKGQKAILSGPEAGTIAPQPAEGQESKSASGKPIVWRNGQWVYK